MVIRGWGARHQARTKASCVLSVMKRPTSRHTNSFSTLIDMNDCRNSANNTADVIMRAVHNAQKRLVEVSTSKSFTDTRCQACQSYDRPAEYRVLINWTRDCMVTDSV